MVLNGSRTIKILLQIDIFYGICNPYVFCLEEQEPPHMGDNIECQWNEWNSKEREEFQLISRQPPHQANSSVHYNYIIDLFQIAIRERFVWLGKSRVTNKLFLSQLLNVQNSFF